MAAPSQAAGERDLIEMLVEGAVVLALVAVASPVLVVAALVGTLIEERSWPRWPFLLLGGGITAAAVATGAWHLYLSTWLDLWRHLKAHHAPVWSHLLGLVPLALTGGAAGAPVLQFAIHHWKDDAATRHRREESAKRRTRVRSVVAVNKVSWPAAPGRSVLGIRLAGSIKSWTIAKYHRVLVAPPVDIWKRQALILGETGSGKTVTALVLAAEILRAGWDVYWIDGKADPSTASCFVQACRALGVDATDGLSHPPDGWRGGPDAVINRLLATQDFSEKYYEGIARTVLRAAVGGDPPASFPELIKRMDRRALVRRAEGDGDLLDLLKQVPDRELFGARARYEGIGWAVGAALDGDWSYEDVRAAYVPVGRPANRNQAEEVGAFILEDLLHWALERKPPERRAMVIVDEFSKLSHRPDAAVELVERARSSGVAVVLIGQTWASMGPDETVRSRLAGTVGTVIAHQLKQPDEVAALAGTEWTLERTEQTLVNDHTGLGSQRVANRYVVHPDELRGLATGEAFLINGGRMLRLRVRGPMGEG